MKPSSCKAKGRLHQQKIRDDLRALLAPYGIVPEDIESRSMGAAGEDIMLSPAAKRILNLRIEAKCVEALNIPATFFKHYEKYAKHEDLKLVVHRKNRTEALVTMRWSDLLDIFKRLIK